jgi:hypothetical protein
MVAGTQALPDEDTEEEALASSVENALAYFASQVEEIKNLMGHYVESPVALPAAA